MTSRRAVLAAVLLVGAVAQPLHQRPPDRTRARGPALAFLAFSAPTQRAVDERRFAAAAARSRPPVTVTAPRYRRPRPSDQRERAAAVTKRPPASVSYQAGGWSTAQASWYGPGFYGHRTACGQRYGPAVVGVASKTLPCGTVVTFEYRGAAVAASVIDRGPYVAGRAFDLSRGLCAQLGHCFTGPVSFRY